MRIVLDMQGAQSNGSRNRGIGRYTTSIARAIVRNCGHHEVLLALNGLFPDTIEDIRAGFEGLISQANIRVWSTPAPVNSLNPDNIWRRHTAELIREAFLANLNPDIVVVSSLFEGLGDDAVSSIGTLCRTIPTAVILYDLIPLIYRRPYLDNPDVEAWYETKLDHLRRADLLLAISESSRREAIHYLGFATDAVINISTAADSHFKPVRVEPDRETEIRNKYHLSRAFVIYTGGIDYRKNIEGLIRAYARLPKALRVEYHLAVVCSIQTHDRERLAALARQHGLGNDELVLTGFVSEADLVALYSLCKGFVFPSWHEGFGLPALEAMSCGRAVIGSNTSSLPEVIGRVDALFDPKNDAEIAQKLEQLLTDDAFRHLLEQHALKQSKRFSWDVSAKRAIAVLETWHANRGIRTEPNCVPLRRPKLAYLSPLRPARSGISDYSAELLPELSRHYDIDVVVAQDSVSDTRVNAVCNIRSVAWFSEHWDCYNRVLYNFGNSDLHTHMFDLLNEIPGVVVLHDFFLSGIVAHMDIHDLRPYGWARELYRAHGYKAVQERYQAPDSSDVIWQYPCNLSVLQQAQGVIVHSEHSRQLAEHWYGPVARAHWAVIPHLRSFVDQFSRSDARKVLNLQSDDFIVCSFGLLGSAKLNHRLLQAWLTTSFAKKQNCMLVFVGENSGGEYGQRLLASIQDSGLTKRIRITGWTDNATFRNYLAAADVAVQLRAHSRGETSGTVLDCMNYGLPTIVNAHGSMVHLPEDSVWKLPDEFSDAHLIEALETLWHEAPRRQQLGANARHAILTTHAPRSCADQYFSAIENFYRSAATDMHALTRAMVQVEPTPADPEALVPVAETVTQSIAPRYAPRQLLVDVSELVRCDSKSGIQRVVHNILREWLTHPPEGLRVEPVYATIEQGYRYARCFTLRFLGCPADALSDEPVEYRAGDVFLGLDFQPHIVPAQQAFYQQLRRHGVDVQFVVYDLLCLQMPQHFVESAAEGYRRWFEVVAQSDGAICISKAVSDEVCVCLKNHDLKRIRPFKISWFHLGVDVENSFSSRGMPDDAGTLLNALREQTSFLMVGTLEPRKGHMQTLAAFEELWAEGVNVNLVIVGKQGWLVKNLVNRIRQHTEFGKRLFWLEGISDEYLEKVYAASSCLIAASEGEGFGLPLIETARHRVPIIARDIPVFREIARTHAFYFKGESVDALAKALKVWLDLKARGEAPASIGLPWQTWAESAHQLMKAAFEGDWYMYWKPDGSICLNTGDPCIQTQAGQQKMVVS